MLSCHMFQYRIYIYTLCKLTFNINMISVWDSIDLGGCANGQKEPEQGGKQIKLLHLQHL